MSRDRPAVTGWPPRRPTGTSPRAIATSGSRCPTPRSACCMATIDASIVIIALPAIFRGIGLNPLAPGNISYLLWMIMGYLLVTAVLVVTPRPARRHVRPGADLQPRLRRLHARLDRALARPAHRRGRRPVADRLAAGAGVGGAMLMANSAAILTDAFPANERGMALGINQIAGDLRASSSACCSAACSPAWDWRAVFWVNVPIGVFGTIWAYRSLREIAATPAGRRSTGGATSRSRSGVGAAAGRDHLRHPALRRPHDGLDQPVGARRARRRRRAAGRLRLHRDRRSPSRCSRCSCSGSGRSRPGNAASLLGSIARGGLQFMLIIWLQGIWLPLHGYNFTDTPLWAGIYMLPLTAGFLIAGPDLGLAVRPVRLRGRSPPPGCSSRRVPSSALMLLPVDFPYWAVRAADRPQRHRLRPVRLAQHLGDHEQRPGAAARRGLRHARDVPELRHRRCRSAIFFSLMIAGLAATLPRTLSSGLRGPGRARCGGRARRRTCRR